MLTVFLAAGATYAGFQWTVQLVVYRQFAAVPAAAFADFERAHQRRISVLVAPLFAALVLSTGWLLIDRPAAVPGWAAVAAAALVAIVIGMTAFGAVPLHRRLSAGWDPGPTADCCASTSSGRWPPPVWPPSASRSASFQHPEPGWVMIGTSR